MWVWSWKDREKRKGESNDMGAAWSGSFCDWGKKSRCSTNLMSWSRWVVWVDHIEIQKEAKAAFCCCFLLLLLLLLVALSSIFYLQCCSSLHNISVPSNFNTVESSFANHRRHPSLSTLGLYAYQPCLYRICFTHISNYKAIALVLQVIMPTRSLHPKRIWWLIYPRITWY